MKTKAQKHTQKSTIVRSAGKMKLATRRTAIRLMDSVLPKVAARWAEELYLTPPRYRVPESEQRFMEAAHRFHFTTHQGKKIVAWSWGDGPTVFFLHGWGGRAGQFYLFVEPLVRAGFSVVAIDVPGHGQTPGQTSSIVDFCHVLAEAVDKFGPAHAVIAHSLGAAATVWCLRRGLRTNRVVLIAPPSSPAEYSQNFAIRLGVSDATRIAMEERLEERYQMAWKDLDVAKFAGEMTTKSLIIHDSNDHQVPVESSRRIAQQWQGSELIETEALGHTRILKDPKVIHRAVSFIENLAPRGRKGLHLRVG